MAKVGKTRKNIKIARGKIDITKPTSSFVIETIEEQITRAEYLIKAYDDLMINAYRKKIGASEYEKLHRIALKNLELCITELKNSIVKANKTSSQNDIERLLKILGELNMHLISTPKSYQEACVVGQMSIIKLTMKKSVGDWIETKSKCAKLCDELNESYNKDLATRIYNLLESAEKEIEFAVKEALGIKNMVSAKSTSTDETLKTVTTKAGFLLPKETSTKEDIIRVLETKLSTLCSPNMIIEYRIVIETIRALGTFEKEFTYLYRQLGIEIPTEIALERESLDKRTISFRKNVGHIMADSETLSNVSLDKTTKGVAIESGTATKLETAKEDQRRKYTNRKLGAFKKKMANIVAPFKKILGTLESVTPAELDREPEQKSLVNRPLQKKEGEQ